MEKTIRFKIDGKECECKGQKTILDAAKENGVYIPSLCYLKDLDRSPGSCRVCTVEVGPRKVAACTALVMDDMEVSVNTDELKDMRKAIIDMLFVEGNHYCPGCEKSGDCQLQALAYYFKMLSPIFPYKNSNRSADFYSNKLVFDQNRCILCKRCVHKIKTDDGKNLFSFSGRGKTLRVRMDVEESQKISDELAEEAQATCPVGAILKKGKGFDRPTGTRKYDIDQISSEIENGGRYE
jgi:[NiFe] hydrogenase diaphorase moiety small subunit